MSREFCKLCGPDDGCLKCQELESRIKMLEKQLALTEKWRDNFKLAFEKEMERKNGIRRPRV